MASSTQPQEQEPIPMEGILKEGAEEEKQMDDIMDEDKPNAEIEEKKSSGEPSKAAKPSQAAKPSKAAIDDEELIEYKPVKRHEMKNKKSSKREKDNTPASERIIEQIDSRNYQDEAYAVAKSTNTVMVGDTGVGKTYVAVMMCKHYAMLYPEKHIFFLAPTQQLVMQHEQTLKKLTNIECGAYVGKELDYWNLATWQREFAANKIMVMTPQVVVNLLIKGSDYLTLEKVSLMVFDEAHHASLRHPYVQIARHWDRARPEAMPRAFGMTACPRETCAEALHSEFHVCDAEQTAGFAALAAVRPLEVPAAAAAPGPRERLLALTRAVMAAGIFNSEAEEKIKEDSLLHMYETWGAWVALRYLKLLVEFYGAQYVPTELKINCKKAHFTLMTQLSAKIQAMLDDLLALDKAALAALVASVTPGEPPDGEGGAAAGATARAGEEGGGEGDGDRKDGGGGGGGDGDKGNGNNDKGGGGGGGGGGGRPPPAAAAASPRLQALLVELARHRGEAGFRCLVFVEWRISARLVSEFLACHCDASVGFIVGQADSAAVVGHRAVRFREALDKFRSGETQILVTTNVSSEGIDIPQCNLVICLEPLKTSREFLQTRGRARHESGKFLYMIPAGDDRAARQMQVFHREAEAIRKLLFQLLRDKQRRQFAGAHPRLCLTTHTGARVDLDCSHEVLMLFYQSIAGYTIMPQYSYYRVPVPVVKQSKKAQFWEVCELPLPNFLEVGGPVVTPPFATRGEAKRAAAYLACRRLRAHGLLDEYLFPPSRNHKRGRADLKQYEHYDPELPAEVYSIKVPRPGAEHMGRRPLLGPDGLIAEARSKKGNRKSKKFEGKVELHVYAYTAHSEGLQGIDPIGIAFTAALPGPEVLAGLTVWCARDVDALGRPLELHGPATVSATPDQAELLMMFHLRLCTLCIDRTNSPYLEKIETIPEDFIDKGYMVVPLKNPERIHWANAKRYVEEPWIKKGLRPLWPIPEHNENRPDWLIETSHENAKKIDIYEIEGHTTLTTEDIHRKFALNRDKEGSAAWDHMMHDGEDGTPYQVLGYPYPVWSEPPRDAPLLRARRLHKKLAYDTMACTIKGRRPKKKHIRGVTDLDDDSSDSEIGSDDETGDGSKRAKLAKDRIFQEWFDEEGFTGQKDTQNSTEEARQAKGEKSQAVAGTANGTEEPQEKKRSTRAAMTKSKTVANIAVTLKPVWKRYEPPKKQPQNGTTTLNGEQPNQQDEASAEAPSKNQTQNGTDETSNGEQSNQQKEASIKKRQSAELERDEEHQRWKRARRLLMRRLALPHAHDRCLLPASTYLGAVELLPALYQIERRLQSWELRKRIGFTEVPLHLVEEATTKPKYERLEVIGDAYVGFVAAWYVFQLEPVILDEGGLSDFRVNLVRNLRFLKHAIAPGRELHKFIGHVKQVRNQSYDYWDPSCSMKLRKSTKMLQKVPADVVEALIGAYVVGGGDRAANALLAWLGLPLVPDLRDEGGEGGEGAAAGPGGEGGEGGGGEGGGEGGEGGEGGGGGLPFKCVLRLGDAAFRKPAFSEFYGPPGDPPAFSPAFSVDAFEATLGYSFKNRWLLLRALTHPSFQQRFWPSEAKEQVKVYDYQRLEFLGDSVIKYLVVAYFYVKWPDCQPHDLTMVTALHVSNWKLAVIAMKELNVHKYILYDSATVMQSIANFDLDREDTTPKAVADVFEALVGAVFLDSRGDVNRVHSVCWHWIEAAGRVGAGSKLIENSSRANKTETKEMDTDAPERQARRFGGYEDNDKEGGAGIEAIPPQLLDALEQMGSVCSHSGDHQNDPLS